MLRRVSSLFQLIRTPSWRSSKSQDATPSQSTPKSDAQPAPKTLAEELSATAQVLDAAAERKAFDASLKIVSAPEDDTFAKVSLPYQLQQTFSISAEGHLRAYANAGLVDDAEAGFHATLRENPAVALAVTSLHIVLQGPREIDLTKRDATMATQRKGIEEWARTVPALKNLVRVKVSHFSADEGQVYVPGEDEAEKGAAESERGYVDVSPLVKALAWYAASTDALTTLELDGVDVSEEAARAFEGSTKIAHLRLEACPARVSSLIPRLASLSEVAVIEKGGASAGCDYLNLLSHVKDTLTAVSLTLQQDGKIDLQEFLSTFAGSSSLSVIQCSFSTDLTPDELEQKLKDAFPSYGRSTGASEGTATEVSTPTKKVANTTTDSDMDVDTVTTASDVEMVKAAPMSPTTPQRKTVKRSTIVEKRKEELRIAAAASEKSKLVSAVARKTRATPQRLK